MPLAERAIIAEGGFECNGAKMGNGFKYLSFMTAFAKAVFAAAIVGVALYDIGFPGEHVRVASMVTAILLAALIAVDFFGKKHKKAK
jgi:hypothetical protein